jgi:hypothetical protein
MFTNPQTYWSKYNNAAPSTPPPRFGSVGSFNPFAAAGMGGPVSVIAEATKETAKNTAKIAKQRNRFG